MYYFFVHFIGKEKKIEREKKDNIFKSCIGLLMLGEKASLFFL
jgi:hypothetical protein